jgi:hypothetical protein
MEQIKINKGDWSGEETALTYDKATGEFTLGHLEGYRFRLVLTDDVTDDSDPLFNFKSYEIKGDAWPEDHVLGTVYKFDKDARWVAQNAADTIDRDHENRFVAAAQLLCNII